jgi:DNA-binding beta-propeller fold protein YncE
LRWLALPLCAWLTVFGCIWEAAAAEGHPSYLGPIALAVAPDGKMLYVACQDAGRILWLNPVNGEICRRLDVPHEPTGLALSPDGTRLAVTCAAAASQVLLVQAESGDVLANLAGGHSATCPTFDPLGQRLSVCNRFDNTVSIFDVPGCQEIARPAAVREPVACAVTPDGQLLLVANHLPATRTDFEFEGNVSPCVTVIDMGTFESTQVPLAHGANGLRGLCVSPDGRYAFVTHVLSNFQMVPFRVDTGWIDVNVVSIIDIPARRAIRTMGLDEYDRGAGNPWQVATVLDGKFLGVNLAGTHELSVIETSVLLSDLARRTMQPMMGAWPIYTSLGDSPWRRIALPGKGPRALTVCGSKVYSAEYFSDTVAVVDLDNPDEAPPRSLPLGPAPELTEERRGELLFHDATICYQHWLSCSSCHPDGRMDALNWDLMNDGVGNAKNTKSMLLSHVTPPAMAEGVRMSAEEAVRAGIVHILFTNRPEHESTAMDAYLKSLQPIPSPYLVDGRLSAAAARGHEVFMGDRARCARCHPAPLYTDLKSHNVGSRNRLEFTERFDTPTLIECWRSAPYLHDGRYATIRDLLVEGQHGLRNGSGEQLTSQELDDLIEFVISL